MTAAEERRIVELARSLEGDARTCLTAHPVGGELLQNGVKTGKRLRTAILAETLRVALQESEAVGNGPIVTRARGLVEEADGLYWALAMQWRPWAWQIILSAGLDESLVQEAMYGLYLGAIRFEPSRGRFSTYARSWLKQIVRRARQKDHLVPRPPYLHELLPRIEQAKHDHPGQELSVEEIARLICSKPHLVKRALEIGDPVSLDAPASNDDSRRRIDLVTEKEYWPEPTGEELAERTWAARRTWAMLLELAPRRQLITILRHGLDGGAELSLQEIATAMSVSRERIRQIQTAAAEAMLDLPGSILRSPPSLPKDPLQLLDAKVRGLVEAVRCHEVGLQMP